MEGERDLVSTAQFVWSKLMEMEKGHAQIASRGGSMAGEQTQLFWRLGETMGKPWEVGEDHGKTGGKPWEVGETGWVAF